MKGLQKWPLLLIVLTTSVVVLLVGWTGAMRPVENGIAVVVVPIQYTLQRLAQGLADIARIPQDLQHLRAENQRLQMLVDQLTYQLTQLREIQIENANLRGLLGLKDQSPEIFGPDADLLVAQVIGRDPSNLLRYLTIDRGSQDQVKPGMPVITARGLVGQISEVRSNSAKVVLLTDLSSAVPAMIQRSRATGMVEGLTGPNLMLRKLPQTEGIAQPGDLVLTSGLGGRFPRRLVIGEITEVQRRDIDMFQEARIRPAVDYDQLEMVIVVRHFTPIGTDAQGETEAGRLEGSW